MPETPPIVPMEMVQFVDAEPPAMADPKATSYINLKATSYINLMVFECPHCRGALALDTSFFDQVYTGEVLNCTYCKGAYRFVVDPDDLEDASDA